MWLRSTGTLGVGLALAQVVRQMGERLAASNGNLAVVPFVVAATAACIVVGIHAECHG